MATKRLLGVFAHPNDEGTISGTLLHYSALGVETALIYATRGEVGDIADQTLATPDTLGEVREAEMHAAADILHVQNLSFLGYRDSGITGSPENQNPRAFMRARPADVIGKLVAIIRQFRPHVMITFDEAGGYGHPDHIAIYKYATGAFHAAADEVQYPELGPAHTVAKLYYSSFARRQLMMMSEWLEDQAYEGFVKDLNVEQLGLADDQISVLLDVERYLDAKIASWEQHRTQMSSITPFSLLSPELQRKMRSSEYFQLVASRVGYDTVGENDLFAHIL